MAKNILVLSCDFRETRAALIEDGIIAELHIERKGRQSSTVGNVYLGKVTRVLPGLQAAFIDIGQERAAFLHVEDLIRPDDFDEYLAGGRKLARSNEETAVGESEDEEEAVVAEGEAAALDAAAVAAAPALGAGPGEPAAEAVRDSAPPADEPIAAASAPKADHLPVAPHNDLETTVAYPNWPEPPSGRSRNGATKVDRALNADADGAPSSEPVTSPRRGRSSPPPPPISAPVIAPPAASATSLVSGASADRISSPSVRDLVPAADGSGEELLVRGSHDDGPDSGHSLHSAPTLDELPEEDDDLDDEDIDHDDELEMSSEIPGATPSGARIDALDPLDARGDASPVHDGDARAEDIEAGEGEPEEDDDLLDTGDLPGFTITDPGEPVPRAPAPARTDDRGGRGGGRRRRGRGRGGERGPAAPGGAPEAQARGRGGDQGARGPRGDGRPGGGGGNSRGDHRGGGSRDRRSGRSSHGGHSRSDGMPGRISKTTPIRDVVREGQEIIVQVTKDPIGTKGARCSSHISLPGRYVVYLPTVDHIGISKRIGSDKERARLREAIEAMKPPSGGLIVRTVAEGLTKKGLKQDVGYLVRLWGEIAKKREGAKAPYVLSSELDLVLKVARDLFTDDVDEVVIDDKQQYERLCRFVEMFAPDRVKDVKFYDEDEPIFDEYGIEDEIQRALSRKVPLPSGGHLIIDQAEALTAIDVNTGRFVGKGSKDMEETILKTNLEAVNEIAYQLRFRNIGGLIILDLIDMEQHKNREKVRRTLEELLQKDKAKTTLNRISELGLIEMTRKRTRESLGRLMHEPCFYCDGTGQLQSKETIAYEIMRELRRKKGNLPGYSVIVNAHPAVADVLNSTEKASVTDAENKYMRKIIVVPRKEYHLEQFDLVGK
ncbi:MAG: Cytoplasmic axial filament protein CafA and Ribonuclease [Labilithrix sp.]|nr:Cytoplasmic axial filament protein CafA and Ribonuclease [Labilithrix sp.]